MIFWLLFLGFLGIAKATPWRSDQAVFKHPDHDVFIQSSRPFKQQLPQINKDNTTTITFDEIQLPHAITNISYYYPFNISTLQVFDPVVAAEEGLVEPQDTDCAVSSPNALLGSRTPGEAWPRLIIFPPSSPNSTTPAYFHLNSYHWKVLGYTPPGQIFIVNGYEIVDGQIVNSYGVYSMYLREGYQKMGKVPLVEYGWWTGRVNALEFWAETRDGKKDYRFCIDDLVVVFE